VAREAAAHRGDPGREHGEDHQVRAQHELTHPPAAAAAAALDAAAALAAAALGSGLAVGEQRGVARVVQHGVAGEGPAARVRLGHEGAPVGPQCDEEAREAREVGEGGVVRPGLVEGGG